MIRESNPTLGGVRVLIADDQPAFRLLLRQILAGLACRVVECEDGAAAVAICESEPIDWALLDWMTPRMDGLAAARAIRARHSRIYILIMSAHVSPTLERECIAAGALGFLPKERMNELPALLIRASGDSQSPTSLSFP